MTVEEWKQKNPPIQRKPFTNADRIRAMTDEELADWMTTYIFCTECMFFNDDTYTCNYEYRYRKGCNGAMLDWLKKEVDDGD